MAKVEADATFTHVDLGITIVDKEALTEMLRVASSQQSSDIMSSLPHGEEQSTGWQAYYIWAPAPLPQHHRLPSASSSTLLTPPSLPAEAEDDCIRDEVLKHLNYDQRIACCELLLAALGNKASAEKDLLVGTLLPPPYTPPRAPDEIKRSFVLTQVALLDATSPMTVPLRRRRSSDAASSDVALPTIVLSPAETLWFICTSLAVMPTTCAVQLGLGYTGVHRTASRRLCQLFSLPFVEVVVTAEKQRCMAIIAAANVDFSENEVVASAVLEGPSAERSKLSRRLKMGALVFAGGAVCVLTGALAAAALAPAIAGLAGVVGSVTVATSEAAAGAGAASAVLVTLVAVTGHVLITTLLVAPAVTSTAFPTAFGAYGATLTGYRAARRVGGVSHFRMRRIVCPEKVTRHGRSGASNDDIIDNGDDSVVNHALVAHGPATRQFVGAETEHRLGFGKIVAALTREHAAMRGALVDRDELEVAYANLVAETPYRCVAALAMVNRVGEHMALAARQSQAQPVPSPPPVDWRVVRRITLMGTCRFAPVSHIAPRKAGVTVWHNQPRFPTGAEAIVVLRPVLKATANEPECPIGEDDLWVYFTVSALGKHQASALVLPSAHTDASVHGVLAQDRIAEADDNLDAMVVTDMDVGNFQIHADADEVLDTADEARYPEQVHQRRREELAATDHVVARYITRLQQNASEESWCSRSGHFVFHVEPGPLTVATLRMTADEFAESEITAEDRGFRSNADAVMEAQRALSRRCNAAALSGANHTACVILAHGADDEADDPTDSDADDVETEVAPVTTQPLTMQSSSFIVDKLYFWHAEPLPLAPPSAAMAGDPFTTFPTERTPREVPLRRSAVLPFRAAGNASLPVLGLIKPVVMVVRLRHRRLDASQRALFLVTAINTSGKLEYAMQFNRDDVMLEDLARDAKRKRAPSATDERDYKNHLPALDTTDASLRLPRFSVTAVVESDDNTIKYVIVDEHRRRRREARRRMGITVGISGFTLFFNPGRPLAEQQEIVWERHLRHWSAAAGSERYVLEWEPDAQNDFGHFLDSDTFDSLSDFGIENGVYAIKTAAIHAVAAAVTAFLSAIALPQKAMLLLSYIDNCIAVLSNRAVAAGRELAAALLSHACGCRPVTLIGYSFGAVVALECAKRLVEVGKGQLIEGLYLLGATCPVADDTWRRLREGIPGRIVNVYYTWDMVLALFLKVNALGSAATSIAGLNPVAVLGVENIDASSIVKAHTDYAVRLQEVLDLIPEAPTWSSMHPAGHNPGAVVMRGEWESAAASLCVGALPTSAPFRMARGLSSGCAFAIAVSSCMLTAPNQGMAANPFSRVSLVLEKDRLFGADGESLAWAYAPPHAVPPGKTGVFAALVKKAFRSAAPTPNLADSERESLPEAVVGAVVLYRVEAAVTASRTTRTQLGSRGVGILGHVAVFATLVLDSEGLPRLRVSSQLLPPSCLAALQWLDLLDLQQIIAIASAAPETSFPDVAVPMISTPSPDWNVYDSSAPLGEGVRRQGSIPQPPVSEPTTRETALTSARWQAAQVVLRLSSFGDLNGSPRQPLLRPTQGP